MQQIFWLDFLINFYVILKFIFYLSRVLTDNSFDDV